MHPDLTGELVQLRRAILLDKGNYADAGSTVEIVGHVDAWFEVTGLYTDKNGDEHEFTAEVTQDDLWLPEIEDFEDEREDDEREW